MAGNEIETIKYLFLRKDEIILNHLGKLINIGAPEKDGSITNVETYEEISKISTENSSKKADVYLNNQGISFKQKGASFPFNRLQRAQLLKVFEYLKFENPEDQLNAIDNVVNDFHNGKLSSRSRPWKELFTEEQFKTLTKFLMMDGSPNLGISNNKAEFILTSPKIIKNDDDIDVYTFDEYFETFKNDLTFSIRRVWFGQSSNSEHKRAKGLVKNPGNQEWIYKTISGEPRASKTTGKKWRDDVSEKDRRTVYIIFVEKIKKSKKKVKNKLNLNTISNNYMNVISFFAGAGGLDLGFQRAGFNIDWANEYDKEIWETYVKNHPHTILDKRSMRNIPISEIPDKPMGIVGGPPCQSWSEAGALRGINDKRGQLFYNFIEVLEEKQPLFFLAENVSGMLSPRHKEALSNIKDMFKNAGIGYDLSFELLNVSDYGVPQDRKRVFFIGFRRDLNIDFKFPKKLTKKITLEEAIGDLKDTVLPAREKNYTNGEDCKILNHEYMIGNFSTIFMSRNRVRSWDEQSFTIQAGGRHAPIHPQAPKMKFIEQNKRIFVPGKEHLYRRLSVRECARIQTFPDDFKFYYNNVTAGYKMIGNAVPVEMAQILARQIKMHLESKGITEYIEAKSKKSIAKLEAVETAS